ncbi:MAG: outer membrane protein transport protein [Pirellulales bacterium]|jgi:long-chain fatty acid transport protein
MNRFLIIALLLLLACSVAPHSLYGQGVLLSASGPVNRSLGGAATAAPLDAMGALRWNPATLSGLSCSELTFGADLLFPLIEVESSITGLAAGSNSAEPGVSVVPTVGWSHKCVDSPITIGLGVMGVAGFRTNYPASLTNPVLMPQSNTPGNPGGLGRIYTEAQFLDVTPTVSWAVSDSLSIGASPILTLGEVVVDPLVIAPPDDADGSGQPRYSTGAGSQMQWGAGAQLGAFYIVNENWRVGAAIRTPSWMRAGTYLSQDELGNPKSVRFAWDLPLVASGGVSYVVSESTLLAFDLRYIDYAHASGWGDSGFNADGSMRGLGWNSVMSLAIGLQHQIAESLILRAGYTFNENPTPSTLTMINVAAPLHYEHELSAGGSYYLAPNVSLNAAYTFYLPHSITGPLLTPAGPIPNTSVTSTESVHVGSMGVTVYY